MKLTNSRQFWKGHIERQATSGPSQAVYCKAQGLNKSTFSAQKSTLSKEGLLGTSEGRFEPFIPIEANGDSISIELSTGVKIIFDKLPEAKWVAKLLGELNDTQAQ